MMRNMRRGVPNLFKQGTRHLTGLEQAVLRNIEACHQLGQLTRTSLGPNGMNKLIVNNIEKLFVTNDTATILEEMELEHPAAKIIVMAANMQESEVGDCSNLVVCLAGELLHQAEALVLMGLHPSEILTGYEKAAQMALKFLEEDLVVQTQEPKDLRTQEALAAAVSTAVSSKQMGNHELISNLVAEACLAVMPQNPKNFLVDNVRVCKILGGDLTQSEVVRGVVARSSISGNKKRLQNAQIAVFSCSIGIAETETKGTVLIHSADELENYNLGEEKALDQQIRAIRDSGVNVVVTGGTIDDLAAHLLEKHGLMSMKIASKFELRRLCRASRARPLPALTNEGVPAKFQGHVAEVAEREIGLTKITVFRQADDDPSPITTLILRASTHNLLNDVEKAVDDGVNTVRAVLRDGRLLAGGGAAEIALAAKVSDWGRKQEGLGQYTYEAFARALEIIPRTLAENAGLNAEQSVAKLYSAHQRGLSRAGVSALDGVVDDIVAAHGVVDLLKAKLQAIRLAVDAAVTILRVDQIIWAKPAGGPKFGKQKQFDDDED